MKKNDKLYGCGCGKPKPPTPTRPIGPIKP